MSSRTRHPAASLLLFLVVCGLGYLAYVNREWFRGAPAGELLSQDQKEVLQEKILEEFRDEMCFHGLRSQLSWRPNEQRYLQDIEIEDGDVCEGKAREICELIAQLIQDEAGVVATVIAYDRAGRELARRVK